MAIKLRPTLNGRNNLYGITFSLFFFSFLFFLGMLRSLLEYWSIPFGEDLVSIQNLHYMEARCVFKHATYKCWRQ